MTNELLNNIVKVVNEDGDSITDAKLKISSIRYLEDGTEKDEGGEGI